MLRWRWPIVKRIGPLSFMLLCLMTTASGVSAPQPVLASPKSKPVAMTPRAAGDPTVYPNVQYGVADGYSLLMDIYVPTTSEGPFPAVIVIHGGGFVHGDKAQWSTVANALALDGFTTYNANYRQAPPGGIWHFPAPVDDLRQAVLWVRANAATYATDPTEVGALGGSAGGTLAMMLATTGTVRQDKVEAAVSWSGMSWLRLPPRDSRGMDQLRFDSFLHLNSYIGCASVDCPERWDDASPALHVDSGDAPIYIANGSLELVPVDQANFMASMLTQAEVANTLQIIPGNQHALNYASQVTQESAQFLHNYLPEGGGCCARPVQRAQRKA